MFSCWDSRLGPIFSPYVHIPIYLNVKEYSVPLHVERYNMLSDFNICGLQDIALSVRGDFRTLNSVERPKDYEDYSSLCVFSPQNDRKTIMTRATMQLIET